MSGAVRSTSVLLEALAYGVERARSNGDWLEVESQAKRALVEAAQPSATPYEAEQIVTLYLAAALGQGSQLLTSRGGSRTIGFSRKVRRFAEWAANQSPSFLIAARKALEPAEALLAAQAEGSMMSLVRMGAALRRLARPDLAIRAAQLLMEETGSRANYYALTVRGAALIDLGDYDAGLADLHQAEKFGPTPDVAKTLTAISRGYRLKFVATGDLGDGELALDYARSAWKLLGSLPAANAWIAAAHAVGDNSELESAYGAYDAVAGGITNADIAYAEQMMQDLSDSYLEEIPHYWSLADQQDKQPEASSDASALHYQSSTMSEERCLHELLIDQCASCKSVMHGPAQVYVTKAGQVYHWTTDCKALVAGWNYAFNRGQDIHDAAPMHVNDAISRGLARCMGCTEEAPRPAPGPNGRTLVNRKGR